MKATHLIWRACGSPAPCDGDGIPIEPKGQGTPCASCGEPGTHRVRDAISDNFTTTKNASRAWPFGGADICPACLFSAKTLALRCALSFSTERGIWFIGTRPLPGIPGTRPDALGALLSPPEPPFVAMYPLAGIDHGGESNLERMWWPGRPNHARNLNRLQSKHNALYARVAHSRLRYPLQVDDVHDVVVDVPLWARLRDVCGVLLGELRAGGVGANDARDALLTLRPPPRCPSSLLAHWRARTSMLQPHHGSMWWPIYVPLLAMPELVKTSFPRVTTLKTPKKEALHAATEKRDRPGSPAKDRDPNPQDPGVSPASGQAQDLGGRDRGEAIQQSLF